MTSIQRRRRIVGVPAFLFLLALLGSPLAALATNVGSQGSAGNLANPAVNGVWYIPTSRWDVARRDLTTTYSNGVDAAISSSYGPTDLAVGLYSPATCGAAYELCVYDADYGDNGYNGWNQCIGTVVGADPNRTCSQQRVQINQFYSPPAQRIACHEMAHSVGLRHTQEQASCVKRTADGGNSQVLSSHDIGHLNARY